MSHMLVNAGHMVQDVGTMWKKPATTPPVQNQPGRSLHRLPDVPTARAGETNGRTEKTMDFMHENMIYEDDLEI